MYYVYLLKSYDQTHTYVGYSADLKRRVGEHNRGKSVYTNKFKPWKLSAYTAFDTRDKAQAFERYLKTGSGTAFLRKHFS